MAFAHFFCEIAFDNFFWNFDYNFRRFGRNYRKNYRKSIYRHLFNYRQNYRYRSRTSTNYRRFQGIIGKVIDIENYRRIIENLSISKKMTYRPPLIPGDVDDGNIPFQVQSRNTKAMKEPNQAALQDLNLTGQFFASGNCLFSRSKRCW